MRSCPTRQGAPGPPNTPRPAEPEERAKWPCSCHSRIDRLELGRDRAASPAATSLQSFAPPTRGRWGRCCDRAGLAPNHPLHRRGVGGGGVVAGSVCGRRSWPGTTCGRGTSPRGGRPTRRSNKHSLLNCPNFSIFSSRDGYRKQESRYDAPSSYACRKPCRKPCREPGREPCRTAGKACGRVYYKVYDRIVSACIEGGLSHASSLRHSL